MTTPSPKYLPLTTAVTASMRRALSAATYAPRVRAPSEAPSITYRNASTHGTYRTGDGDPFHQVVRDGADMAYRLPSKGIGA